MILLLFISLVSAKKYCFFCEYSYIVGENGNPNVTLSGTANCLLNLAATDDDEITIQHAAENDLCFTEVTESYTNVSDVISLKRGIFYNSRDPSLTYPIYSNRTTENVQCINDLCNTYESNYYGKGNLSALLFFLNLV